MQFPIFVFLEVIFKLCYASSNWINNILHILWCCPEVAVGYEATNFVIYLLLTKHSWSSHSLLSPEHRGLLPKSQLTDGLAETRAWWTEALVEGYNERLQSRSCIWRPGGQWNERCLSYFIMQTWNVHIWCTVNVTNPMWWCKNSKSYTLKAESLKTKNTLYFNSADKMNLRLHKDTSLSD